ncbi:MAG: hypothetical protein CMN78_03800 [Spirochaetales bacterium]|nr:hypothetical protein [Spirochaetales bacterium]
MQLSTRPDALGVTVDSHKIVGKRIPRTDAASKVTGSAAYADDMVLPGMLFGIVLRCPHPHARIVKIDIESASQIPGVRGVITCLNSSCFDSRVRYPGQKIGAVVAVDFITAERAAQVVHVEYELLPPVYHVLDAIQDDSPIVRSSASERLNNVCSEKRYSRGDIERGFEIADVIAENEYFVPAAHQGYMEPHCCIAKYERGGTLRVWSGVQGQFNARAELARLFGLPLRNVDVEAPEIGGAFGGKTSLILEPIAVELSKLAGAPVKLRMSRREELMDSRPGPGCLLKVRTGATEDGKLIAEEADIFYDTGASPGAPAGNFNRTRGLYRIPNFRYDVYSIFTNKLVPGPYRAPGALEMTFAFESQMDILSRRLKMSPVEFRLNNAVNQGDSTVDGKQYPSIGLRETLKAAQKYINNLEKRPGLGIGVACGKWMNAVGASSVLIALDEDGGVNITTGAVDLTGVNTVLAQLAAEELGIPIEAVTVITKGTDAAPYAAISGGSRTAYGMTLAVHDGVVNLKLKLQKLASSLLGISSDRVNYKNGAVHENGRSISLIELARTAMSSSVGPISVTGSASNDTWLTDSHIFITQIAEASVDEKTGSAIIHRISSFQDVGFAMNPTLVEGQIEGGIVQGYGWGMLEGLEYHRGAVLNNSYVDYKIPTALDAPEPQPFVIEVPSPSGPYGIKGVGEPSMVAAPAAVANALFDATDRRVYSVPFAKRTAN